MYWSIGSQKKNIRESHLITNCVNFLIKRFFIEISNYNDLCTLQEINIPHLGKRKMIFKYALSGGYYVNSLEGNLPLRIQTHS